MAITNFSPNYQEIVRLPNFELSQRVKSALDEYIEAIRQGKNVAEKAEIYQAYEDERLKRVTAVKRKRSYRAG